MTTTQTNETATPSHESYWALVWKRFKKSRTALAGAIMTLLLLVLSVGSNFFAPFNPGQLKLMSSFMPPQRVHFIDHTGTFHLRPFTYRQIFTIDQNTGATAWADDTSKRYGVYFFVRSWEYKVFGFFPLRLHLLGVEKGGSLYLLGTDKFGRDLWSRSCEAGQISIAMAMFATIISVLIGSFLGIVSGFYGGKMDLFLQRFIEFLMSFPTLALLMALAAVIPKTWDSFLVFVMMSMIFALLSWTVMAREIRGKVLALRETDFVLAGKEMGASGLHIILKHLYPNTLSHIIVVLTLNIPGVILAESTLSFLGIGIQPPLISWGILMHDAQNIQTLGSHPWIMSPVIFILIAVLGFNFLGDGLRDAADPYSVV